MYYHRMKVFLSHEAVTYGDAFPMNRVPDAIVLFPRAALFGSDDCMDKLQFMESL